MTSQETTAQLARPTEIPCLTCPHCGATEPRALIGEKTGALIGLNPRHFTDERGYFFCRECAIVWDRLPHGSGMDIDSTHRYESANHQLGRTLVRPRLRTDPWVRMGIEAPFEVKCDHASGDVDVKSAKRLRESAIRANAEMVLGTHERAILTRISDRIRDADTLCTALHLDPRTRDIILEHVEAFSVKADLRKFPRIPGTKGHGYVREEAYVVATVLLVAEQMKVNVDQALALDHFTFTKGRREIGVSEVKTAMRSLQAWFRDHHWMSG